MFEAQGLLEAIHVAGVPVVRLMLPAPEPLSILEPVIPVVLDVQTESIAAEWEWDASKGLQSAKQWSLELNACKASGLTATDKLIAWAIREHVNVKDGTVYIGSDRVAQFIGRSSDNVKKRRKALQDAGWFQDTGRKVGFAKVWRLNIPECDCGAHGGFTPVRTKG
ncbi:hypothetical protein SAMN05216377_11275 [Pseudonocardia oroxyli]|uniref:Uncharacterized protein n=2 Tax=Pseudonocardia oroxyli TaxID=366584 RepID=A0A1G7ULB7_PSEOR|nr:hypothetical protein SAMN05216377_11275 [Pseudonocardia oroxyli]